MFKNNIKHLIHKMGPCKDTLLQLVSYFIPILCIIQSIPLTYCYLSTYFAGYTVCHDYIINLFYNVEILVHMVLLLCYNIPFVFVSLNIGALIGFIIKSIFDTTFRKFDIYYNRDIIILLCVESIIGYFMIIYNYQLYYIDTIDTPLDRRFKQNLDYCHNY